MAKDNEYRLLCKAIKDRNISPLLERGIDDSWFFVAENREVFNFLKNHWTKYNEVPTAVTVLDNFPTFTDGGKFPLVEDTVEYLVDQLVEYRRRIKTLDYLDAASAALTAAGHDAAIEIMGRGYANLMDVGIANSGDVDLTEEPLLRFQEYLDIKLRPNGLLGMATGFHVIDLATAGLQPGQLVTIIAPPKTGKSVLAMQMAVNIHRDGAVPMFQSFEMTNHEQKLRHDAMRSHISFARLQRSALTKAEENRYKDELIRMETMHKFWLTESIAATTISQLALKVEQLCPQVLFVDGVYLMTDEITGLRNEPIAIRNITQSLKRLAQKYNIPVVQTTQAATAKMRAGKVTADSISFSASFHQDSDVILALQRQDEDDDTSRLLKIVASRNSGPAETELLWDWEEGKFQEYGA